MALLLGVVDQEGTSEYGDFVMPNTNDTDNMKKMGRRAVSQPLATYVPSTPPKTFEERQKEKREELHRETPIIRKLHDLDPFGFLIDLRENHPLILLWCICLFFVLFFVVANAGYFIFFVNMEHDEFFSDATVSFGMSYAFFAFWIVGLYFGGEDGQTHTEEVTYRNGREVRRRHVGTKNWSRSYFPDASWKHIPALLFWSLLPGFFGMAILQLIDLHFYRFL